LNPTTTDIRPDGLLRWPSSGIEVEAVALTIHAAACGLALGAEDACRPSAVTRDSPALNHVQLALLSSAEPTGVAARTIRAHSELRWLAHLGLLCSDDGANYLLTDSGRLRLASAEFAPIDEHGHKDAQ
jgi:hypothetical protein